MSVSVERASVCGASAGGSTGREDGRRQTRDNFHRINVVVGGGGERACVPRWLGCDPPAGVKEGHAIIMDRARSHRKRHLEAARGKAKARPLSLPACSPDFNPTEKDWVNMRRASRDAAPVCDLLQSAVYNYWR
ncbi:MAG: transposase [Treponema sp.]|nr:transposase [Treponema sp.]